MHNFISMNKSGHEKYMRRCLQLAENGMGFTAPNPMVGCVIVHNDIIIGEGYHRKFGEAHAEVNAINSVKDKSLLKESIIYVSLEPCSHFGKTPPCSDLIIRHGIPEAVIGCIDSYSEVAGRGVKKLSEAGCKVTTAICEQESRFINRRFFTFHEKKRPYIILKWAQTSDGFIDIIRKPNADIKPNWITDETCRQLVHKWRSEEQAILVGANTVLCDDPELNIRSWTGRNPLRIVIDRNCSVPEDKKVFNGKQETIVFNELEEKITAQAEYIKFPFSKDFINEILIELYNRNIQSVIIEGGSKTHNEFIRASIWDEARIFTGPVQFNRGIPAPEISGSVLEEYEVGNSQLKILLNKKSGI